MLSSLIEKSPLDTTGESALWPCNGISKQYQSLDRCNTISSPYFEGIHQKRERTPRKVKMILFQDQIRSWRINLKMSSSPCTHEASRRASQRGLKKRMHVRAWQPFPYISVSGSAFPFPTFLSLCSWCRRRVRSCMAIHTAKRCAIHIVQYHTHGSMRPLTLDCPKGPDNWGFG